MSFGQKLQHHLRRNAGDSSVRPVTGHIWDEDGMRLPDAEAHTVEAEVVEGTSLEQREVAVADVSGLTHFLDGVQRTKIVLTYNLLPVVRAFVAAAVRVRGADRRMSTFRGFVRTREALVMPFELCPPERFLEDALDCLDCAPSFPRDMKPADRDHPAAVREAAHRAVGKARAELEQELTRQWCPAAGPHDWLLVDGGIPLSLDSPGSERVVGLIKSHQTRYFTGKEYRRIMELPEGRRTSVFRTHKGDFHSAYSWYVRLREDRAQDPSFGLVRVEAKPGPEAIRHADAISAWILAERCPVSLPDGRWDRMIYPIRDCEQYLKAISPSQVEMDARLI